MRISSLVTALATGVLLTGLTGGAQAAPIADSYWGGNHGTNNADVVGDVLQFQINSATITRTGTLGADLSVIFDTTYSGSNVGTLNTNLGALFFGEISKLNFNGSNSTGFHEGDTYIADEDRFAYVFDFDAKGPDLDGVDNTPPIDNPQDGAASLYKLIDSGSTIGDDIVKSNLLGDTNSANIRRDQAVDIVDVYKLNPVLTGTWETSTNSVSFYLSNFFVNMPAIYQTSFTLSWAMTCANDVFLTRVAFNGNVGEEVPLPAGVILLFSGLLGLGFLGRFRAKASGTTA